MILEHHLAELRNRRGFTDETIDAANLFSVDDAGEFARILKWERPDVRRVPAIAIPFPQPDGTFNCFARLKPDKPRTWRRPDGTSKPVKYEQPRGERVRVYIPPQVVRLVCNPQLVTIVTEGEFKALRAAQDGFVCIGLCGVSMWAERRDAAESSKRPGPRVLLPELRELDWRGRITCLCFDTDAAANPDVHREASELASVLAGHGADVRFIRLPYGPCDSAGMPGKMGIDDFLIAHGKGELQRIINHATRPRSIPRSMDDYRRELQEVRERIVGSRGVCLDRSPTGAGKTTAERSAVRKAGASLTVLPNHRQCEEVRDMYLSDHLDAEAYPQLNNKTCLNFGEAERAMESGLSVQQSVCLTCPKVSDCAFKPAYEEAEEAAHGVATHSRAALCLDKIAEGRPYITIHEDANTFLRRQKEIAVGFDEVAQAAFAAYQLADDEARFASSRKERAALEFQNYFHLMRKCAESLSRELRQANQTRTTARETLQKWSRPGNVDRLLWRAMNELNIWPPADAMEICKAAAAGELVELAVRVDTSWKKGGAKEVHRVVSAVWETRLPPAATVVIADATADASTVETLVGRPVVDITPPGPIARMHPAVQVPLDVTKRTGRQAVVNLLRGVMMAFPSFQRIGVITHREHVKAIRGKADDVNLDPSFRSRVAKVDYFHGSESRGVNSWQHECDLLVILGTPRVGKAAIQRRLIQMGRTEAAARDGRWSYDYWHATTVSGGTRTARTLNYRDWDWRDAYRNLCSAELVQALGRARSICEAGIPVVAVSVNPLGLPVLDAAVKPLSDADLRYLEALRRMQPVSGELFENAAIPLYVPTNISNYSSIVGTCSGMNVPLQPARGVSTAAIATHLGVCEQRARSVLKGLSDAGLIEHVGQKSGWRIRDTPETMKELAASVGVTVKEWPFW
jgi:hypothetical protein